MRQNDRTPMGRVVLDHFPLPPFVGDGTHAGRAPTVAPPSEGHSAMAVGERPRGRHVPIVATFPEWWYCLRWPTVNGHAGGVHPPCPHPQGVTLAFTDGFVFVVSSTA